MGFYDWGNPPINSTGSGQATNPDTSAIVATIDSTQLGTAFYKGDQTNLFRTTWIVGCSTTAIMLLEQSSGTANGATFQSVPVSIPTGQSGQYIFNLVLRKDDRLRVRMNSSVTAVATGFIQAETIT